MRSLAVFFMIIVASAGQAFAQGAGPQPLTRSDCEAAFGWKWNETTNVCDADAKAVAAAPKPQPLTRADCGAVGMLWNDRVLACEDKSKGSPVPAAAQAASPAPSTVLIDIDKSTQQVTVSVDGAEKYRWPVSTGKYGFSTPSGTYTALSMNEVWYSKEWDNAPMPHAIFFMKDGHAIHGSYEVRNLGKPASHGCVRISPQNATILFDLVKKAGLPNTQVVLSGETPGGEGNGGEGKVASAGKPRTVSRAWPTNPYFDAPEPRRGGFFRRLFGAR